MCCEDSPVVNFAEPEDLIINNCYNFLKRAQVFSTALLLLLSFTLPIFSQSKISTRLQAALADTQNKSSFVNALVLMQEQVDITSLDKQLYAEKASLEKRAYTVITQLQKKAEQHQPPLFDFLAAKSASEITVKQSFWIANLILVEATPDIIIELSRREDVKFIDIDPVLSRDIPAESTLPISKSNGQVAQPGLKAINAHLLWEMGITGKGCLVMNLDTGVNLNHPALRSRWRGNRVPEEHAWFDPFFDSIVPNDRDNTLNHGTHTMGTITGLDTTTFDTIGVAFGAEWIASNAILGGLPFASRAIMALEWAMNPDGDPTTIEDMPDAICNSWQDALDADCLSSFYFPVLNSLEAAGIAVVFSAGNNGPGIATLTAPKNLNINPVNVFAVGAVDANLPALTVAPFSARGPSVCGGDGSLLIKPEVSAPGVSVLSSQFNSYGLVSGTSMAAPHVVGAIALLKQAYPQLTGYQLKMALYETARDLGTPGEDNDYGTGIIDVYAAFVNLGGPNAPTDFVAYSDYRTPASMSLSWKDPKTFTNGDSLFLDDYKIFIERNETLIDTVAAGVEQYIDDGLTDGETYTYTIFAKLIDSELTSLTSNANWIAGGSPTPSPPTNFQVSGGQDEIVVFWQSPNTNIDGTPLDDFAGIRLYQNDIPITIFERAAQDTGKADSAMYQPDIPGYYDWRISAIDNEFSIHESDISNVARVPLNLPFREQFDNEGIPNASIWSNFNAEINDRADNPPSGILSLNLNGSPDGEDILELKPVDLSQASSGMALSYFYQPQGQGNAPEADDSLQVYLKNNLGEWILVREYTGSTVAPFQPEAIDLATMAAGTGSFFHSEFQVRFRSTGGASIFPNDDWFIDDVYLGADVVSIHPPGQLPQQFAIKPNYPNPFNPETTIEYQLPQPSKVVLEIYNTIGQKVRTIINREAEAGFYKVRWYGRDNNHQPVASGIYIYQFRATPFGANSAEFIKAQKMVLIK